MHSCLGGNGLGCWRQCVEGRERQDSERVYWDGMKRSAGSKRGRERGQQNQGDNATWSRWPGLMWMCRAVLSSSGIKWGPTMGRGHLHPQGLAGCGYDTFPRLVAGPCVCVGGRVRVGGGFMGVVSRDQSLWQRFGRAFMEKKWELYGGGTTETKNLQCHFFQNNCLSEEEMVDSSLQIKTTLWELQSVLWREARDASRNLTCPQRRFRLSVSKVPGGCHDSSLLTRTCCLSLFALQEMGNEPDMVLGTDSVQSG